MTDSWMTSLWKKLDEDEINNLAVVAVSQKSPDKNIETVCDEVATNYQKAKEYFNKCNEDERARKANEFIEAAKKMKPIDYQKE